MNNIDISIENNIEKNYKIILNNIKEACNNSKRNINEIKLIAVSKTKPISYILKAKELGLLEFGENKVQEILEKNTTLDSDISWHMIGHLQTNKVKYIVDKVKMIHSVDSLKLAAEIDKQCKKNNIILPILIEVNVSNEETKYGLKLSEVENFIKDAKKFDNIRIEGLMTVAPYTKNPNDNRIFFRRLKEKMIEINEKNFYNNLSVLSMGMSNDYMVAIEEGATIIRVGSALFGERNYT